MIKAVICDDEQAALNIIEYFIVNENLPIDIVGTAQNGMEALELIRDKKPDLAFLDIHMPYMSGFEIIKKVKNVKVIIVTAHNSFEYAQKALRLDVCDIISKPIDFGQLRQAIIRAIGWNFTDNHIVNTVLAYIHLHYRENIRIEDLVKVSYCTESHLSRLFKKHTQETIVSYIHKVRISKAAAMLKEGNVGIQEAALQTGYQNLNNFYKYFKANIGDTPAVYLKKLEEDN